MSRTSLSGYARSQGERKWAKRLPAATQLLVTQSSGSRTSHRGAGPGGGKIRWCTGDSQRCESTARMPRYICPSTSTMHLRCAACHTHSLATPRLPLEGAPFHEFKALHKPRTGRAVYCPRPCRGPSWPGIAASARARKTRRESQTETRRTSPVLEPARCNKLIITGVVEKTNIGDIDLITKKLVAKKRCLRSCPRPARSRRMKLH